MSEQPGQAYDPYGGRDPYNNRGFDGGWSAEPATVAAPPPPVRPGAMTAALVLLVVSSLVWVVFGVLFTAVPLTAENVQATGVLDQPELKDAGVTAELVISTLRGMGVAFIVVALVYVALAIAAFVGQRWARVLLTVMTVFFVLFLVLGMAGGTSAAPIAVALAALPLVGTGLMYTTAANDWFRARR